MATPPSRIARFYGNLGWKGTDAEVQLVESEDRLPGLGGLWPADAANRTSWPIGKGARNSVNLNN
jgi:hypothetical protein